MKLYMKQKVFSWRDRFKVWDEAGSERYSVEGELFTLGKRLHVYDRNGSEAAYIREKVWSFLPRYFVYVNGQQVAEIVKRLSFLRPKYEVSGLDWEIRGSLWEHDYEVLEHGRPIVSIHKKWMSWGDSYELDIADSRNELPALAVVLAIDCVMASEAAAASSASN